MITGIFLILLGIFMLYAMPIVLGLTLFAAVASRSCLALIIAIIAFGAYVSGAAIAIVKGVLMCL